MTARKRKGPQLYTITDAETGAFVNKAITRRVLTGGITAASRQVRKPIRFRGGLRVTVARPCGQG
jgi:hypothetical protein